MKPKYDSLLLGISLGIAGPLLALIGYYLYNYSYMEVWTFIQFLRMGNIYTPLISLCVIANLLFFFIFIWTNRLYSARGVLMSTFIYAGIIFYLKIFVTP